MDVLTRRTTGLPLWSDHTAFVRRHGRRIGALMVAGVLIGLGWSVLRPDSYTSTVSLSLVPVPAYVTQTADDLAPPAVSIDTDAQLLHSPRVLTAVGDALGTEPAAAGDHLTVTASPNSRVLHVSVTADDATDAAAAAEAAADALVAVRRRALGALSAEQLRQLRFLAARQESILAREQGRRMVTPASDELFSDLLQVRTRLTEIEAARRTPAEVIRPANTPGNADYANAEVPMTSGALLGMLIGCLAGARQDRTAGKPARPEDDDHVS